jgi:hypothetical protein
MNKEHLELYTDYLLSTFGQVTATGLSAMANGQVSHDQVTRFLSEKEYTSKDLWQAVKAMAFADHMLLTLEPSRLVMFAKSHRLWRW